MQDLTIKEEEKGNYLLHISLNQESNRYQLLFADGKKEEGNLVSNENYQKYLKQMEEQYYTYEQSFRKSCHCIIQKEIKKMTITFLLTLLGIYLDYCFDIHVLMKMFIYFFLICGGFLFFISCRDIKKEAKRKLFKMEILEYFLQHKEDFLVMESNEIGEFTITGGVSLNTIEQYNSLEELKRGAKKNKGELYLTLK